ncbi:hypothetical protein [Pseudomonas protegens]|uniref:hypothetical protein n=1 Tax=Pseudomonas protegens TaxID=380021 RepID=UPI00215E1C07|nr:hypothetical protein [Pseudomonas protegens]UVL75535.1 hypothetical protein LOY23_15265 [Pseudomonas protegens]
MKLLTRCLNKDVSRVETSEWAQVSTPWQAPTTLYFLNLQFLYKLDTITAKALFKRPGKFSRTSRRHLFMPGLALDRALLPYPTIPGRSFFPGHAFFLDDRTKERKNRADILWMP